jgi:hypothetical protein
MDTHYEGEAARATREHGLNISRITEQALTSILDYLDTQNTTESSKFLAEASFLKEGSAPRWPSLVGHRLGKAAVAGSNPARGSNFLRKNTDWVCFISFMVSANSVFRILKKSGEGVCGHRTFKAK